MRTRDATIPEPLDALVTRCLQPSPSARYQTSSDLLRGSRTRGRGRSCRAGSAGDDGAAAVAARGRLVRILAGAALVVVLGAAGFGTWQLVPHIEGAAPAAGASNGPTISLAVLPFRNASGDPALDSLGTSLGEVLATDLGETSQIRTIPSVRLREVLRDLRIDANANLSPSDLTRIADFASAQTVLWGQYVKFGEEIRIDATLQNLKEQKTTPLKATAANQSALLAAVAELAGIRPAGACRRLVRRAERAEVVSVAAVDAVVRGAAPLQRGAAICRATATTRTAAKSFEAAVEEDANFALRLLALARNLPRTSATTRRPSSSRGGR